jgi:hypothetical protein
MQHCCRWKRAAAGKGRPLEKGGLTANSLALLWQIFRGHAIPKSLFL